MFAVLDLKKVPLVILITFFCDILSGIPLVNFNFV